MLKVYVDQQLAGSLFKPETELSKYHFTYAEQCPSQAAVSLSMPVFDMNLPEGALAERLRRRSV